MYFYGEYGPDVLRTGNQLSGSGRGANRGFAAAAAAGGLSAGRRRFHPK